MKKIVTAYFCDFEPIAQASHLEYHSHTDWYNHERAKAIHDACEEKYFAGKYPWRQAYFASIKYRFHDAREHQDVWARKEIAGPFLTEQEALKVACEMFDDAVEDFRFE